MFAALEALAADDRRQLVLTAPRNRAIPVKPGLTAKNGLASPRRPCVGCRTHLALLPPYSPELQSAERLWPMVNEGVANQLFEHSLWLEDAIDARCIELMKAPEHDRARCDYRWWPRDVAIQ